jgi:hypothetical protein
MKSFMLLFSSPIIIRIITSKKYAMRIACDTHWLGEKLVQIFDGKSDLEGLEIDGEHERILKKRILKNGVGRYKLDLIV